MKYLLLQICKFKKYTQWDTWHIFFTKRFSGLVLRSVTWWLLNAGFITGLIWEKQPDFRRFSNYMWNWRNWSTDHKALQSVVWKNKGFSAANKDASSPNFWMLSCCKESKVSFFPVSNFWSDSRFFKCIQLTSTTSNVNTGGTPNVGLLPHQDSAELRQLQDWNK